MSIRSRIREAMGPSKAQLQEQITHLEHNQAKFGNKAKATGSGVEMGFGEYEYEHNSKLQGAGRFAELDKMEADPHVKGALLEKQLPLITAEWEIVPASEDDRDVEIAEFCTANLLRKSTERFGREYWIQTSWKSQRLPEILNMLRDGFSMFVSSWRREGTKQVYDRLQWIEPKSIDGTEPWELDDQDNIVAINRKYNTPSQDFILDERIEAERLKMYVWDMKGARFEGRSFIRSMYGAWMRKEFILRQATIWAQKIGAPIPIGYYPANYSATDRQRFKQLIQAARGSSPAEAFGMFPLDADGNKAELQYFGAETGEVDRMRGLIDGENKEIGHGGANSSGMLGETESGSRALGDSKGKKEVKFTQAIGQMIGEWETHGVGNLTGVIEELVDRNYAGVLNYPELVVSKVDPFENFSETIEAWKAGIVPKHEDARRQIVEGTLGMNLPDDAYEIEEPPPMIPGALPAPDGDMPDGQPKPDEPEDDKQGAALESATEFRKRIAPLLQPMEDARSAGTFRKPTVLESTIVDLAAVGRAFRFGERDILTVLREGHQGMINDLMGRLRNGEVTIATLDKQRRSIYRGRQQLQKKVAKANIEVADTGTEHANNEIERQAE
jgi:hypothetical protein